MYSISFAITVCNEHEELIRLVNKIFPYLREEDEIVIQADLDKHTREVEEAMIKLTKSRFNTNDNVKLTYCSLNGDFAAFKNKLKNLCTKDYIFFLDADEFPDSYLLEVLPRLLEINSNVDLYLVPRVNTVEGITEEHIKKWGWKVDEFNRVNYPDLQTRIMANKPEIEWQGKVHERLVGYKTLTQLPFDLEQLSIHHPKTIAKQEQQNKFYETL